MSGFREQLSNELEKRHLSNNDDTQPVPPPKLEKTIQNKEPKFSFRTFSLGLILATLFLTGLVLWAFIIGDKTTLGIQKKLTSKTVLIDTVEPIKTIDVKPIVVTPPNADAPIDAPQTPESTTKPEITSPMTSEQTDLPTTPKTNGVPLVSAPIPGLYESTDNGLKPQIRAKDGLTPFNAYKKPFTATTGKPTISFVINNVGLSKDKTYGLIEKLPDTISLAFSPYASNTKQMQDMARQNGHEVWMVLPLETKDYPLRDPGPLTLLKNVSEEQNQSRLTKLLTNGSGYAGFISNKDHIFDSETARTSPSINEIYTRGLVIIDSKQSMSNFTKGLTAKYDAPYGKVDMWLDDELTPIALNRQIRQMIEIGKAKKSLVVMLNNYPASINALNKFLSASSADDFQLAPLSHQVQYAQ